MKQEKKYRVWMVFPDTSTYQFGTYDTRDRANEIAMQVRDDRGCDTHVEEVLVPVKTSTITMIQNLTRDIIHTHDYIVIGNDEPTPYEASVSIILKRTLEQLDKCRESLTEKDYKR